MTGRRRLVIVGIAALVGALAYLRDPSWLNGLQGGFAPGGADSDGVAYRRTHAHAWFFVPSDVEAIDLPVRAVLTAAEPHPIRVRVRVNDTTVADVTLDGPSWQHLSIPTAAIPARGRRHRRVDVFVNRVWEDGLTGLQVGDVRYATAPPGR